MATQCNQTFGAAVSKARDAVTNANKRWSLELLYPDKCTAAFGDMINVLVPNKAGRKVPCPRLFTYGDCRIGSCKGCHSMTRAPSREQIKKFTTFVENRCGTILEDPSKV